MKETTARPEDIDNRPPDGWVGFIDYRVDFDSPDSGVSFHWWENRYTTRHYHNHYEFFIVTSGQVNHQIGSEHATLQANTLCFVKPNDVHQLIAADDRPSRHINIAATVETLGRMCALLSPDMRRIVEETEHFTTRLNEEEMAFFLSQAEQINMCKNNYANETDAETLLINEMLLHALIILYKRRQKTRSEQQAAYPPWFSELLQKLHTTEYFTCPLTEIYALSHYSPPVLLRYFKEYTGETLISFLTKIKINYACSLLKTTNFTILDIANKVGYDSLSHFNKVFKRYTGVSPGAYKKAL